MRIHMEMKLREWYNVSKPVRMLIEAHYPNMKR